MRRWARRPQPPGHIWKVTCFGFHVKLPDFTFTRMDKPLALRIRSVYTQCLVDIPSWHLCLHEHAITIVPVTYCLLDPDLWVYLDVSARLTYECDKFTEAVTSWWSGTSWLNRSDVSFTCKNQPSCNTRCSCPMPGGRSLLTVVPYEDTNTWSCWIAAS